MSVFVRKHAGFCARFMYVCRYVCKPVRVRVRVEGVVLCSRSACGICLEAVGDCWKGQLQCQTVIMNLLTYSRE